MTYEDPAEERTVVVDFEALQVARDRARSDQASITTQSLRSPPAPAVRAKPRARGAHVVLGVLAVLGALVGGYVATGATFVHASFGQLRESAVPRVTKVATRDTEPLEVARAGSAPAALELPAGEAPALREARADAPSQALPTVYVESLPTDERDRKSVV